MPSLSERHGPFPVYQPYSAAAPAQETKRNLHAAQAVNNFASAGLAQYNASQNGAPSLRTAALSSAHPASLTSPHLHQSADIPPSSLLCPQACSPRMRSCAPW